MADQLLNVFIKFNKETGALELVKQEVGQFKTKVDESKVSLDGIYKAAVAFGAVRFMQSAIEDAVKFDRSVSQVAMQMKALGIESQGGRTAIINWSEAIQSATRFSNDEAVVALNKVIGATKDLGAAQRLVQLAFDISTATGRDQNQVLDDLSKAYAGNERGVKALKGVMGDYNLTVNSTNDLILMLEKRFGGASVSAQSAEKSFAQIKNQFNDIKRTIGEGLIPIILEIGKAIQQLIQWWQMATLELGRFVLDNVAKVRFASSAIKGVITADAKAVGDAFVKLNNDLKSNKEAFDSEMKRLEQQHTSDVAKEFEKRGDLHATESKKEIAIRKDSLDTQLKILKDANNTELKDKSLTIQERQDIIANGLVKELDLLQDARDQGLTTEAEYQNKRVELEAESANKRAEEDKKYVDDSAKRWEDYIHKVISQNQILEREGELIFDGLADGFGDSIARMIVDGESFRKNFGEAMKDLAREAIAELIKMEIKLLVLQPIAESIAKSIRGGGSGGGGAIPIPGGGAGGGTGVMPIIGGAIGGAVVGGAIGGGTEKAQIGGAIGGAVGAIGGPITSIIGGAIGGAIGSAFDKKEVVSGATPEQIRQNVINMFGSLPSGGQYLDEKRANGESPTWANYEDWIMRRPLGSLYLSAAKKNQSITSGTLFINQGLFSQLGLKLAEGGIVTKPTMALIGEAGPEAVVPLGKNRTWGDVEVNMPTTISINVQPGTSREIAENIVQMVTEQLKRKTPETLAMAIRIKNLSDNYGGRAA